MEWWREQRYVSGMVSLSDAHACTYTHTHAGSQVTEHLQASAFMAGEDSFDDGGGITDYGALPVPRLHRHSAGATGGTRPRQGDSEEEVVVVVEADGKGAGEFETRKEFGQSMGTANGASWRGGIADDGVGHADGDDDEGSSGAGVAVSEGAARGERGGGGGEEGEEKAGGARKEGGLLAREKVMEEEAAEAAEEEGGRVVRGVDSGAVGNEAQNGVDMDREAATPKKKKNKGKGKR